MENYAGIRFSEIEVKSCISKSCFVGILGANQNEERDEKWTNYQTIRKTRREKIPS